VLVTGSLRSRQYADNESHRHTVWEIHARDLLLLNEPTPSVNSADEPPIKAPTQTA
jgi:single-stranded DNA-binding protein